MQKTANDANADAEEAQQEADKVKGAADIVEQEEPATETASVEGVAEEGTVTSMETSNDVPMPKDGGTAKNNAEGTITFSDIPFEKAGTYTYKITEVKRTDPSITYDGSEQTVIITVTEKDDGSLSVNVSPEGTYQFKFTNTYTAPDPGTDFIDPPVKKIIKGPAPKTAETYTFKLEAADASNPMPATANGQSSITTTIKGEGEKEFGRIEFTKEHAGEAGVEKAYDYTVTEVAGDNPSCTYDTTIYAVRAYVSVDNDGKLKVRREYFKYNDGAWKNLSVASFEFVNNYDAVEEEDDDDDSAATGDNNNLLASILLLTLSGLGLGGLYFARRRQEEN